MGKAAKFKNFRKLARKLPEIHRKILVGEKVYGYELPESVKEVEGKPVNDKSMYRTKKLKEVPLNHEKMMKRIYNKRGIEAVVGYTNAVLQFGNNERLKMQHKDSELI